MNSSENRTGEDAEKVAYAEQLKRLGSVISSLERAKGDAELSGLDDIKMITAAALNLCLSTYYLRLRGEYMDSENVWEVDTSIQPET